MADGDSGNAGNAGISVNFQPDLAASAAEVQAGMGPALARIELRQQESAAFINTYGADAVAGHDAVGITPPTNSTPMTGDVFDPNAI